MLPFKIMATTVPYKDFTQLVDESQHVVSGIVKNIKYKRLRDGQLYTIVKLKQAYSITDSGETPISKNVKIRIKGGEEPILDENGVAIGMNIEQLVGTPTFTKGEEVILFISNNGIADMPIYGWGQGYFTVASDRTIKSSDGDSIVALNGADLVSMENGNPVVKGQLLSSLVNTHVATTSLEKPYIVATDTAEDIASSSHDQAANTKATTAQKVLENTGAYSAMDDLSFKSMIQERKKHKVQVRAGTFSSQILATGDGIESLYRLPEVSASTADNKHAAPIDAPVEGANNSGLIQNDKAFNYNDVDDFDPSSDHTPLAAPKTSTKTTDQ